MHQKREAVFRWQMGIRVKPGNLVSLPQYCIDVRVYSYGFQYGYAAISKHNLFAVSIPHDRNGIGWIFVSIFPP